MCSRIIVSRIWEPLKRPKLAQMCHMPKLAELSHQFLPHLAEIRLADTYQYWSLNIPANSLCHCIIKPPFLQTRAWSSEKGVPHPSQLEGIFKMGF